MQPMWKLLAGGVLAALSLAPGINAQYPDPGPVSGDTGVHDPAVVKKPDGTYLLANTAPNIALKTSTDRTDWVDAGVAFPDGAPWTTEYTNGDTNLWAPDLSYHNDQYYMYYSASSFGSRHSAIFLATSATGEAGSWEDQGLVVESDESSDHNAIDANLIVDEDGGWWMTYGSFWSGIKMIAIDPSTGMSAGGELLSIAARSDAGGAIEAPFIKYHEGFYYLWVSFDKCCSGAESTYRTMVGRSESVTGPYVDREGTEMMQGGGTEVMAGHGSFHGTGHQAVFTDEDGDVLVYHWYADDGASFLGINLLEYEDGWPVAY